MGAREQTREIRLRQWAEVLQAKQNSGQTVRAFCEENGINEKRYFYWQRKLRDAACRELSVNESKPSALPSGWMICETADAKIAATTLTIDIGGCQIQVDDSVDTELLKRVCAALKSLC